jgi:predicted PurR-regulated permease PerM
VRRSIGSYRRHGAILIGDQVYKNVGGVPLGNVVISVISGVATFVWLIVDAPYRLSLAIFVALLDLIPFESTVAGVLVAVVALTVSIQESLAPLGF